MDAGGDLVLGVEDLVDVGRAELGDVARLEAAGVAAAGPLDEAALGHHHDPRRAAVVVEGDTLPGGPADHPDLVGVGGQQPHRAALVVGVLDVLGPQVAGRGDATGDVEHGGPVEGLDGLLGRMVVDVGRGHGVGLQWLTGERSPLREGTG